MDEPILTGRVLGGRYSLGARLGAGGWGSVYSAIQTDLGRPVAIKVLHTNVALEPDGLARFEREAKAAAALGHPNIAQVSDFQANPGEPPFLVMELLTGATLGAVLKGAPGRKIAPARLAWIAYQILAGLDVAHRAGIVHRDIKPDNVFLVAMPGVEDLVKILDFGIAKLAADTDVQLTATGSMLGSPAFMAPEQVRSNQLDHRVDLYAVGATMYLALSGRMPFDATTMHGLLLAITEERLPPLHELDPTIDPALSSVVGRAMAKDRDGRFPTAEAMRHALEPWLGGMAAHASATSNAPRMISPASIATSQFASGPSVIGPSPSPSGPPMGTPPPGVSTNPQYGAAPNPPYGAVTNAPYNAPSPPAYSAPPAPAYGAPPTPPPYAAPPAPAYSAPPTFQAVAPAPAAAPAKSNTAVIVLLVAVVGLLIVLVGGGAGAWYFFAGRDGAATAAGGAAPGATTSAGVAAAGGGPAAASAAVVAANGAPANGAPASNNTTTGAAAPGAAAPGAAAGKPRASNAQGIVGAGAPGAAPPAASAVTAGAPGAVPPAGAKKQMAGTNWRVGGGSFGVYEIDASRAAILRAGGGISACYIATEFDAPDHQFTDWTFQVDPAGNVKSVRRTTDFQPHPKFDACMIGALRQVKWAATPAGGSPQINFTARTRDNP